MDESMDVDVATNNPHPDIQDTSNNHPELVVTQGKKRCIAILTSDLPSHTPKLHPLATIFAIFKSRCTYEDQTETLGSIWVEGSLRRRSLVTLLVLVRFNASQHDLNACLHVATIRSVVRTVSTGKIMASFGEVSFI